MTVDTGVTATPKKISRRSPVALAHRYEKVRARAMKAGGEPVVLRQVKSTSKKRHSMGVQVAQINGGRIKSLRGLKANMRTVDGVCTVYVRAIQEAPRKRSLLQRIFGL